ncbi:uncharacterized protein PHALS_14981 [Plasmopara halstedii]|uniref:Uncharacterized protein n=1 Tax=Plasmopara halstedii TaxID=4781 RepID=A0A0P1A8X3_PLAHL|nr:uncharacterized protein PHALS_14981 [Plasmopara halstedii]CEG36806.1 hypothetical protein PHALS_14981 [Plasmopara halstedii]|eukprot:XP_024573175.1 hypothetical protein PHALS_14981 [Plasmopara halstedii]
MMKIMRYEAHYPVNSRFVVLVVKRKHDEALIDVEASLMLRQTSFQHHYCFLETMKMQTF